MKRLRFWLIRRLLGQHKLDTALKTGQTAFYKNLIMFIADKLAENTRNYSTEFTEKLIADFTPELLAGAVLANKALTEVQKDAIMHALQSKPNANTASYLR